MQDLFNKLLESSKVSEVTDILEEVNDKYNITWTPVGGPDRFDNIATINIGTDPAAGLTERITNAIDAVLEKEWKNQGEPADIKSPRKAVQEWFGIENGSLGKLKDARDERIKKLSDKIQITLKESENDTRPTVEIRDHGIGLAAEEFSNTILGLNTGNKLRKLHLMGAFGQGGSTALSYSYYTIIISKPSFPANKKDKNKVAWTIVRVNPGTPGVDKFEWYEYMTDHSNGQPITFDIPNKLFAAGTLVKHISMDLGKYKNAMTQPTGSLWYLAHHYLFDTILPFKIKETRAKSSKKIENRTVTGNNRLLTYTDFKEYGRTVPLTFRDGKAVIYYWVLSTEGLNPKERIKHYTLPSKPIIITFNGQRQGYFSNFLIKNDLKLPFLEKYLLVQIECDNLDNRSKRELFSTTRESLRETSIYDELQKLVIDTLQEDDELKRLDKVRRERYLTTDDTETLDKLRKRLANRVSSFLKSGSGGKSIKTTSTSESVSTKKVLAIPFHDPPTFIEIVTESPKEVYPAKTFSIKFKTDGHPNYFNNPDHFLAVIEPPSFGIFTGTANVNEGHGTAYFKARDDVEVGSTAKITIELRPPRQRTLTDILEIKVVNPPEDADPSTTGSKGVPNIKPQWLKESDEMYKELEWNDQSVAQVSETAEGVLIWVSQVNKNLNKLVIRAQRHSDGAVESIKNRYLEHIAFYAYMTHLVTAESLAITEENGDKPFSETHMDKVKQAALKNACETVCGMVSDFYEVIITESKEEAAV